MVPRTIFDMNIYYFNHSNTCDHKTTELIEKDKWMIFHKYNTHIVRNIIVGRTLCKFHISLVRLQNLICALFHQTLL